MFFVISSLAWVMKHVQVAFSIVKDKIEKKRFSNNGAKKDIVATNEL
jgi:hypothetical protein